MISSRGELLIWATCLVFGSLLVLLYDFRSYSLHSRLSLLASRTSSTSGFVANCAGQTEFDWDTAQPSDKLAWVGCSSIHQCARLKVPLNYSDPDGKHAIIAVIRIPSPLGSESPDYRGPILFNPGGPGGSGVDLIQSAGHLLAGLVGPQFDVVSFDPRGIGLSSPRVSFFETDAERALWGGEGLDVLNASSGALPRAWARAQLLGRLAEERDNDVLDHINTDNTARDMLRITQAHGREKIQYWGFSYGTVLGATFAALFPDRIERLVLDGVVDAENYFSTLWSNNLMDTDKALQTFFDGCAAAGPEGCAFYAPTAQEISRNLTDLYDLVRSHPVPVRTSTSYGIVDYTRLRLTIFVSLYQPHFFFPPLAQALADLAAGDGSMLFNILSVPLFKCSCDSPRPLDDVVGDAQTAIVCTDGEEVRDSLEELKSNFDQLMKNTTWAEVLAGIRVGCSGWPKHPKKHFRGPFVGNTSYPILFVGNSADPVTPVWAAHKMSKGFPGSVVLTQDSAGHTSVTAPSICTQLHIRQYFENGTLPNVGTLCPVIGGPFPSPLRAEKQIALINSLTKADRDLFQTVQALSHLPYLPTPFKLKI